MKRARQTANADLPPAKRPIVVVDFASLEGASGCAPTGGRTNGTRPVSAAMPFSLNAQRAPLAAAAAAGGQATREEFRAALSSVEALGAALLKGREKREWEARVVQAAGGTVSGPPASSRLDAFDRVFAPLLLVSAQKRTLYFLRSPSLQARKEPRMPLKMYRGIMAKRKERTAEQEEEVSDASPLPQPGRTGGFHHHPCLTPRSLRPGAIL